MILVVLYYPAASGLVYEDVLVGPPAGELPAPGKIVGFAARVLIGDKVGPCCSPTWPAGVERSEF